MDEIWKFVPSLSGVLASNWGRVQLPERSSQMPNGGWRRYVPSPTYGYVTKASKTARHSYRGVFNRFFGNIKIHRAVCEAFHGPPPFERAVVIHLDENAHNNRPENLKWGTQKENLNMPQIKAYHRSRIGENNPRVKGAAKAKTQN